jgi:multisubunit Na+/H+ antiporter MnhE subunit
LRDSKPETSYDNISLRARLEVALVAVRCFISIFSRPLALGHPLNLWSPGGPATALQSAWGRWAFSCTGEENENYSVVGYSMNHRKALCFAALPILLALVSCSGPKTACTTNCVQNGTAKVSFTLVADTLPANPSILSFRVSINDVQLTPTTGSAITLTPATPVVDLMRLQSDTAFLGTLANVPAGNYTVKVSLSSPASGSTITFFNDTGSTITAGSTTCATLSVCTAALSANGIPSIGSFTFTAVASGAQGIGLDFNLNNAISLSGGTLTVNLNPASPILTAFALPRTNANLASNQLELLEDFTGAVSVSGNNVTITSPTRGTLTAVNNSSSFFDASPDGAICPTPAFSCVANGQLASVDAFLDSDGTISLKEFEPLTSTQKDLVEGIVSSTPPNPTQFAIVVTDKTQAATGSLIGALNIGDRLTVNISTSAGGFLVDTKGLAVGTFGSFTNFSGQTSTSAVHAGQRIAVHVTAFTAASGTTPASATVDTITLRWSRLIAGISTTSTTLINVNSLPSYFGLASGSILPTQVFSGTLGAHGVTNLDGVADAGGLNASLPVAIRALYLQSTTNSANPAFFAAKVRQH